ncbi:MAG: hypothetical protein KAG99_08365 [Bacteroidales bacterium]|nr:hypothetical protein [Bacteroidales bacterium]
MKKYRFINLMIIPFILLWSCNAIYENGKEMAASSQTRIDQISVAELNEKMLGEEEFHLIDVRQPKELKKGYINQDFDYDDYLEPVNIPRGLLEFRIADAGFWENYYEELPEKESTEIIVYCKSGGRGALAAETLMQLGYNNVKSLSGGYDAWNPDQDDTAVKEESSGCGG